MSGVVVDTNVWIDFFKGRKVTALEDALKQGSVALPPLVLAELISGAKRSKDRAALTELFKDLPLHETPFDHWVRVGDLRRHCIEAGLSVSTPDAHVAQCAIDRDALLLSRDDIFARISKFSALRLHP